MNPKRTFSLIAIVMIVVLSVVIYVITSWNLYWIWMIAASLITFLMYGFDKSQAQRGGLRIPEIVLHILALSGGFPGGWAGRSFFGHKTRKVIFTVVLIISMLLHLGLIYYLFLSTS